MSFLQFIGEHPLMTVIVLLIVCQTILEFAKLVCNRKRK